MNGVVVPCNVAVLGNVPAMHGDVLCVQSTFSALRSHAQHPSCGT